MRMACHAARVLRQRHKAEADMLDNDISPEQRKCLETAFEAADKNGDGILSADEYYEIFQTHGLSIDREWIERTIAQNDKDGDGGISLEEFIEMNISRNKRQNPQISVDRRSQADILQEKAKLAFNAYDRNRDGYLTKAEMKRTSKSMTEAQVDAVFEKYDKNKDGRLDFEEFKELMSSNSKGNREQRKKDKDATTPSSSRPSKKLEKQESSEQGSEQEQE